MFAGRPLMFLGRYTQKTFFKAFLLYDGTSRYASGHSSALPVQNEPDSARLMHHLSAMHPTEVGPYLRPRASEDISSVAMQAFECVISELESASWIPGPSAVLADRAQFFEDISPPFYGYNRSGANVSQGVRDSFWRWFS